MPWQLRVCQLFIYQTDYLEICCLYIKVHAVLELCSLMDFALCELFIHSVSWTWPAPIKDILMGWSSIDTATRRMNLFINKLSFTLQ